MRKLTRAALLAIAVAATGCSDDHFTIRGNITDGGTQNIRIMYPLSSHVETQWITLIDNKFSFEGVCEEPTVVYIFNQQRQLLAHFLVENGQKVEFVSSMKHPYRIRVKGSRANEKWNSLINEYHEILEKRDYELFDEKIDSFIQKNPDDIVSALLLTNDYSTLVDQEKTKEMFAKISGKAQQEAIMRNYYVMRSMMVNNSKKAKLPSVPLLNPNDSIESLALFKHRLNLIYFWYSDDRGHKSNIDSLKQFTQTHQSRRLAVVDINLDSDTTRWKKSVRKDTVEWKRYWAAGGIMNKQLSNLMLSSTPCYLIVDSAGIECFRGESLEEAAKMVEKRIRF